MRYYLRKLIGHVVTLILVSLVTFFVFQILPGDPALIILGLDADVNQIEALNRTLGLDRPLTERYISWIKGLFNGDLGISIRYNQSVSSLIGQGLKVTALLALYSMIFTVAIGIPVGLFLASHSRKKYSIPISIVSQLSLSIPSFCMGILLISIFSVRLNLLPSIGYTPISEGFFKSFKSLLLPSLSIALGSSAILIRYVRVSVLKEMGKDYVRTARSKGLSKRRIMYAHVLKNSLIPVITILGLLTADILGGSIIIENIFSLPGIGRLITVSISSRDLPLIQGLVLYLSLIVVICNFIVDLVYSLVDPRIRLR